MDKVGIRDEKRQHRLSLLGFQSDQSSVDDGRTEVATNEQNESPAASLPPLSRASTTGSVRAEKQASRPSMFRMGSSYLVGGGKNRPPSVARMPSRRSVTSDVESGGIMRGKEPRPIEGPVRNNYQRSQSQASIPGAFRVHANGTIDDDPTVYSQNTKESNPFVIDHASLIENPDLRAHLASGGALPTDLPGMNSATGGPAPGYIAYPMPSYALHRTTTPLAMPSFRHPDAPIGVGVPIRSRRNEDGLRLNQKQIRLVFLLLAMIVVAVVTGAVVAIGKRDEREFPVDTMVVSPPSNEEPLEWNDDRTPPDYSNDAKDVLKDYINEKVFPTLSPTVVIRDPTAAPTSRPSTSKPTVKESQSPTRTPTRTPTQSPSTPSPTSLPTTPKPTEPLETAEPSSAPTKAEPSSSPSTPIPSPSPSLFPSSTPSIAATTTTPTSLDSQAPSGEVATEQPTTLNPTTLEPTTLPPSPAPTAIIFETEGTNAPNATNTTGSDNFDVGQNTTDSSGESIGNNATMSDENITQDFWRDQASVAAADDHAPLNWSE